MQSNCPHCSYKISIDDARVPDRPFTVKCPKCQNAVKFPGKGAAPAAAAPAAPPAAAAPEPPAEAPDLLAQMAAPPASPGPPVAQTGERALVSLPDRGLAGQLARALSGLGYGVDTLDDVDEAGRLLEQGVYAVAVAAPVAGPQGKESLYQRIVRLSPDNRRRLFFVVIADNLQTGDGIQAFVLQADLVVGGARALGQLDQAFRRAFDERKRLYKMYNEMRNRAEAEA